MFQAADNQTTRPPQRHLITPFLLLALALGHANAAANDPADDPANFPLAGAGSNGCVSELTLALEARSAASWQRSAEVEERFHDLELARLGLSSLISVQPSYAVEQNLAKEGRPAEWGPGVQLDANLKYRYDLVEQTRARAALHKAELRLRDQRRADVLLALTTFSRLRVAERAASKAELAAVQAELAWAEAQATSSANDSAAQALDLREARLAAQRTGSASRARNGEIADHQAVLDELGLATPASSPDNATEQLTGPCDAPLTKPLLPPVPQLRSNDDYRSLQLAVELAEARLARAAFAPVHELALSARYQENGARATVQLGVAGGRPEGSMEFRWRDVSSHAWSVGVSATLRLDDSMAAALSTAQAAVSSAEAAVAAFEAAFSAARNQADEALAEAYQELTYAEEAQAIAAERLALALNERDRSRAEQAWLRSLDAYERSYQAYLRQMSSYLKEFGLDWVDLQRP